MSAGRRRARRRRRISRFKAVVFDLDGTLIDSRGDILNAFSAAFGALGREVPPETDLLHTIGHRLEECFIPFLGNDEELCSVAAKAFRAYYEDHHLDKTRPFEDIDGLLSDLAPSFSLGLATMKKGYFARKILKAFSWEGFFKGVAASEEGLKSKPHPEMLLKLISDFGVSRNETLYVGDTSIDIEMSERAGVPFVFAAWGYGTPDGKGPEMVRAEDPAELKRVILGA
ncbi:MAG TPA: HAD family hydrolase [Acidobacteriota bacterium]|jgi:phosphoglycolate phosphatase|nr:HAD family hydrolase [Acidobacteriota bacterium]HNT17565.1 HAD family hydrolase [Acidobacteriota bacterium]HPA26962.1 HAD family hydrolase [Acidobacteriota bacterium]HQO19692.1 HAD family hydrolase [Acidobacteriota bacterium]HQQ46539.1 HAD family hydrolase [Acidobacteriota bacterium]